MRPAMQLLSSPGIVSSVTSGRRRATPRRISSRARARTSGGRAANSGEARRSASISGVKMWKAVW